MNTEGLVAGSRGRRDSEGWREGVGTERLWRNDESLDVPRRVGAVVERA